MKYDAGESPTVSTSHAAATTHSSRSEISVMDAYPAGFEEDDRLRSDFIRDLLLRQLKSSEPQPPEEPTNSAMSIPRTVVRFWHDRRDVPADVRECLDSWDALSDEGVTFRMFCDESAAAYIADRFGPQERAAFARCRHPAMRSDYFRMCFLLAEGGLYVDADDVLLGGGWKDVFRDRALKVQPLCYDVSAGCMVPAEKFQRAELPKDGLIFYVNNNPIAAPAGHPILRHALTRATARLLGDSSAPEIQSTTGPGNLTAVLAAHARESQLAGLLPDFILLLDWEGTAKPCWELAYRSDARNWRNMGAADAEEWVTHR